MPQFQIRCPHCQKAVQATVNTQQPVAQLACPHCGGSIKFRVPRPGSAQPQPAAPKAPTEESFDFLSSGNATTGPGQKTGNRKAGSYQGFGNSYSQSANRRKKSNSTVLIFAAAGAFALVACIAIGVGFYFWPNGGGSPGNSAQNASSTSSSTVGDSEVASKGESTGRLPQLKGPWPNLSRPESVAVVQKELKSLSEETERSVASITDSERHTIGADRLKEFTPKFDALFFRAVQAKPISLTMTEMAQREAEFRAEIDRLRSPDASNRPGPNYVWMFNTSLEPGNLWGAATNEVSDARNRTDLALQSRVCFPDPLKETSEAYDWSSEDRRVLSAYWLQGELEREVASEMMACLRDKANVQQFQDRCFVVIEKFYKPALELSTVRSTQGTMLIDEPKGSPYWRHAMATRRVLDELLEEFSEESVVWTINHTIAFSDAIEDLQFRQGADLNRIVAKSVREHHDFMLAGVEEERLQKLAEEERIKQEQARAEEARIAKAAAEEQERQRQAQLAAENGAAKNGQNAPTGSGVPFAGGSRPFGQGSGRPPFGMGQGTQGSGPDSGTEFNRPQGFGPPPGFGENGPTGPPPGPPKMGTSVTIRIKGQGDLKVDEYLEKLKAALKTGNYRSSQSGSEATLVLEYDGDLESVVEAIDFGTAEISDQQKREISVTVK